MMIHTDKCFYCGIQLDERNFTRDHVVPKVNGGKDKVNNLVPCCKSCNSTKRHRTIEEFRGIMVRREFYQRTGVKFDKDQVAYLESIGVKLDFRPHTFFFEVENLG